MEEVLRALDEAEAERDAGPEPATDPGTTLRKPLWVALAVAVVSLLAVLLVSIVRSIR